MRHIMIALALCAPLPVAAETPACETVRQLAAVATGAARETLPPLEEIGSGAATLILRDLREEAAYFRARHDAIMAAQTEAVTRIAEILRASECQRD